MYAAGGRSVFEWFLRNLPAGQSIPVALMVLNSSDIFAIEIQVNFSNLRFFHVFYVNYVRCNTGAMKIFQTFLLGWEVFQSVIYQIFKIFFKSIYSFLYRKKKQILFTYGDIC